MGEIIFSREEHTCTSCVSNTKWPAPQNTEVFLSRLSPAHYEFTEEMRLRVVSACLTYDKVKIKYVCPNIQIRAGGIRHFIF